jgi:hypothetical protein
MASLKDRILHKLFGLQGWIKWTVYTLLLVNFGYYFWEEWVIATHTLRGVGGLLDWTGAFAGSIDELAWFALLILFELETHVLSDEAFTPRVERTLHVARILCYMFLANGIYSYSVNLVDLEREVVELQGVASLCELADQEISFASNMVYTTIDGENCSGLSEASAFYRMIDDGVVTDARGLRIEKELVWVDLIEAVAWLLIVLAIEIEVRLQNRDITSGPLMRVTRATGGLLYGVLFLVMGYWAFRGQWVYAWDELLWIGGFAVIEMNVAEWREELLEKEGPE